MNMWGLFDSISWTPFPLHYRLFQTNTERLEGGDVENEAIVEKAQKRWPSSKGVLSCCNLLRKPSKFAQQDKVYKEKTKEDVNSWSRIKEGSEHVEKGLVEEKADNIKSAVKAFMKAKNIYATELSLISSFANIKNKEAVKVCQILLKRKIIETLLKAGDLNVKMNQMKEANDCYLEAINYCKSNQKKNSFVDTRPFITYGNFLSVCRQHHNSAIVMLILALKLQFLASNKEIDAACATILENTGHVYMRRSKSRVDSVNEEYNYSQTGKSQQDAKRAETCFLNALSIYESILQNKKYSTSSFLEIRERKSMIHHNLSNTRNWLNEVGFEEEDVDQKRVSFLPCTNTIENSPKSSIIEEDNEAGLKLEADVEDFFSRLDDCIKHIRFPQGPSK